VLTSVHAFASDPTRGFFVLMLLAITVGGSLLLYALKAPSVRSESSFTLVSRESFLLTNNIILVVVAVTVLLGTLYPLLIDALGGGKLSVGPPYFNAFFIPLMALLTVLLGIGMMARWKNTGGAHLVRNLVPIALLSLVIGVAVPLLYGNGLEWGSVLGIGLMAWVLLVCLKDIYNKIGHKQDKWAALKRITRSYYGMTLAHLGVGITIVGIAMVSLYNAEQDLRMVPGDTVSMGGYEFTFQGTRHIDGPNYQSEQGVFEVTEEGRPYRQMLPEKRIYNASQQTMTEAAIDPGLFRDIYLAMGEPLGGEAWAVRVQVKPFVRWIWLGAIFMSLGGLLASMDKRYRKGVRKGAQALAR
jgi:cytochrome c-type biogenesis protein CcmF